MRWVAPAIGLALAAASGRAALGPRYGGGITVLVEDLPPAVEPDGGPGTSRRLVQRLVHETLVAVGDDGRLRPGLAARWSSAAGGREWTLVLAEPSVFHDGTRVTAADAVRSLRRFLRAPSSAAEHLATLVEGGSEFRARRREALDALHVPDPQHVTLRFAGPAPHALFALASTAAAVTSPSGAAAGPFVPVAPPGRRLGLVAFGSHVRGRPFLDRVELLRRDVELAAPDLAPGPGGPSASAGVLLLVLERRPPFDPVAARREVAALFSERAGLPALVKGAVAGSLLPPSLLPALPRPAHRSSTALRPGPLTLAVARDVPERVAQRAVALLLSRGLDAKVVTSPPERVHEVPAAARLLHYVPEVAEPALALRALASLAPASADAVAALAAADVEVDPDRRRALLHRAAEAVLDDARLVPLGGVPIGYRARPGLNGAKVDASGALLLEDAWIEP